MQAEYFDSGAHWLTPEQRERAKAAEEEFLKRVEV
jgi:hypothetical protein